MGKVLKLGLVVLAVSLLGLVSRGFAQVSTLDLDTGEKPAVQDTTLTAGLGLAVLPEYEGSEDYRAAPVPYFRGLWASGQFVQLLGTTLMGNVLPSTTWQAGPLLRYRAPRDNVKNDQVDKMEKVDAAWELGGFAGVQYKHWNARAEMAQDVADGHDGFLLTLTGGYTVPVTQAASVNLSLSTTYASVDYMKAYFGVDREDAVRSGLDEYDANANFKDVSGTVLATYRINADWGLLAAVRYTQILGGVGMAGNAADSPVVDDTGSAGQVLAGAVVTYTF
ncbi:MAG: MipA/OmpV family protein [Proteobacteria bacterium]|nr:MipA/OmpV family protein [Pseudomonadota bacterium]